MNFYADDPDAYVDFPVTDATGGNVDWADPTVRATRSGATTDIVCTWQGAAAPTRVLRVPLSTLEKGNYELRLIIPGGPDRRMGIITLV